MQLRIVQQLADVSPAQWNALTGTDNPFLRHEFLNALETNGCIGPDNGWQSSHLLIHDDAELIAAAPAYLKSHSWGEFVFDWSWADAHARRGLSYYPKLIIAVPYSPVTGPRLLTQPDVAPTAAVTAMAQAVRQLVEDNELSSAHWLFTDADLTARLQSEGYAIRSGCQFHWTNPGYQDFAEFLATLTSKKRKNLRQERRRVATAGIRFDWLHGDEIDGRTWEIFERLYRSTFLAHGNEPVLTTGFFRDAGQALGKRLLLIIARQDDDIVAGALFLRSGDTLYGRYWGSTVELSGLHFETCYYQGIEYCIRHGLKHFEPGAQGEHKVARGFLPTATHSAHWIRDPVLRDAIGDFLDRERQYLDEYMAALADRTPYRQTEG